MTKRPFLAILLVMLISEISVVCGGRYVESPIAFAQGSSQPVAYVSINITNNQDVGTPNPFQVMIDVNSTEYAYYEASDLSNVAFAYQNGSMIPSWLESGNSNSSTDTVYWLKIDSIPAKTNVTVLMKFYPVANNVLNNMTTGEAPQLSPTYGEYDDGPNVFITYSDFNNNLAGWQASLFSGSFSPLTSPNGIKMLNGNGNEATYLVLPKTLPSTPIQVEEAWSYSGDADAHAVSIGVSPFGTTNTVIFPLAAPVLNNSISAFFDYYGGWTGLYDYTTNSQITRSSFAGGGNFHIVSFLTLNGTWASAGYLAQDVSLEDFGSTPIPAVVNGPTLTAFSNPALVIGAADGGAASSQYVRWIIVRALPPNGIPPSVILSTLSIVPEFPSIVIVLPACLTATLLAAMITKRKHTSIDKTTSV